MEDKPKSTMSVLSDFFENHVDNSPPTEHEYIKDDLKHCKVCNKPKQCIVNFLGSAVS